MPSPVGVGGNCCSKPRRTDSRWCCASCKAFALAGTFKVAVMTWSCRAGTRTAIVPVLLSTPEPLTLITCSFCRRYCSCMGWVAAKAARSGGVSNGLDQLVDASRCQGPAQGESGPLKKTPSTQLPVWFACRHRFVAFVARWHGAPPPGLHVPLVYGTWVCWTCTGGPYGAAVPGTMTR